MLKMGSHDPFGHLKHKLWPEERSKVKLPIWLLTTKSQESPWFPCFQVACNISLESFRWRLQFCFKPHLNRRSTHKVTGFKVVWVPTSRILRLQLGSPRTKWHLNASPVAMHKEYYKGEGGGFPQVRAVVSFVNSCLPVACPCIKGVPIMH
jgi:hypothetical protein